MTDRTPCRDPDIFASAAESARLCLRKAGPAAIQLHGEAAACLDQQLADLRDWCKETAENRRRRVEREARGAT